MYAAKMKRNRVLRDQCFDGDSLKEESKAFRKKSREIMGKFFDKVMK
jgi:hypothetical protein